MSDLAAAWAAVHDNTPDDWYLGRPGHEERYDQWSMYTFDPSETLRRRQAVAGVDRGGADGAGLRAGDGAVLG